MAKMPQPSRNVAAWVFFGLAALVLVSQAVSLYDRGKDLESDFGVFYRTCRLLDEGAGGEVYRERDSVTGWPISIPPAGLALFQPFSRMSPPAAAIGWGLLNLAAAIVGCLLLRRLVDDRLFPWIGGVFLALASGSMQVGQFSILFASAWILGAWLLSRSRESSFAWAWPAATKLYPTLLVAVPLSLSTSWKTTVRHLAFFCLFVLVFAYLVPLPFYGSRVFDLNASFANEVLFDTGGRLKWMQALGTTANQGLDAVLIRYLSWYPKFHEQYSVPTLALDLDAVRLIGHAVRAVILAYTIAAVVRWRKSRSISYTDALKMAALWSATLYLCLPETRARYAVYVVLAFIPLAHWCKGSVLRQAAAVAVFLLVLGVMPKPLEVYGAGLLATLALWLVCLQSLRDQRPHLATPG